MDATVAKHGRIQVCELGEAAYDLVMKRRSRQELKQMVRDYLERLLRRKGEPQEPEDPYSYVTAPKKPRPHQGSAAAADELDE
jgi:uncharacterized protein YjiS (DUF1127 family)